MQTIYEVKEQAVTEAPLLVFDCVLLGGLTERWSTHRAIVNGATYEARVMQHNVFEMQTASEQGVDGIPKISIVLANADSHFSEIERSVGWKGSRLTVGFLFYDLRQGRPATETTVLFQGICNSPDEIREATFRITATNRMNLQRLLLPQVRIERRCPWEFPANAVQRQEAIDGGANGKYSRYYRCGYSAGEAGGAGNLDGGAPYTACGYTRGDCQDRGMLTHFGGIEFVPPAISVRTYGDKSWHTSAVSVNAARYNDFVPLVYGTVWYEPPVVFARNDGNLTRMEVLLGIGEMQGVVTVLVNDVEIPLGVAGTDMTGTGWYNLLSSGARAGAFDMNFVDSSGQPAGDPYGSMAYMSVVAPNRLSNGTSLPSVKVRAQGLKLPVYTADGNAAGEIFTNNPAWILLDLLRRTGWGLPEIDIASFAAAAAYCDEEIQALDLYGNPTSIARFQCNFALQKRRSAGDVARGVRNAGRLLLTYGANGALRLGVENTLAAEQPSKPAWSNSTESLNGGWPSYEFGDGSNGFSGILRRANGEPSVRVYSRSIADTPNRFSVEFQDSFNDFQQDSYSLVNPDDVTRAGQEVSTTLNAIGLPNYDQAGRILKVNLDKSVQGNTYMEFETSVRAFGVRPGDLITVTYLKEGFVRQPFRILKLAPGANHRVTLVTAQIHDDAWYADSNGQTTAATGGRRQDGSGLGTPRPLLGTVIDANGEIQFGVTETDTTSSDGAAQANVSVNFIAPEGMEAPGPAIPLVSLSASVGGGGSLKGGQTLYYAVSAVDAGGGESPLSFLVRATLTGDGSSVTLRELSFAPGTSTFRVYRGSTPARLFRIGSDQSIAAEFTDTGLAAELVPPADTNFDHANFYWRMELQPEAAASTHSVNSVGNPTLGMAENRYRGMIAWITRGPGAGQERTIVANSATTLTVAPAWTVEPGANSYFVVAESGWRFGALTQSSPVQFTIPNLAGEFVEICGRAANANDVECAAEISTVTRWQIGGSGFSDEDRPPAPYFGLAAPPRTGSVVLSGVSFNDLTNTRTISAGTLTLYYRDELQGISNWKLTAGIDASDAMITISGGATFEAGKFVQVDAEVICIEAALGGSQFRVTRGTHTTTAAAHGAQAVVFPLLTTTAIAPFPVDFFGSPSSGSWTFPVPLPDARVASAELFVTNARGNSTTRSICLTNNDDLGLRTFSGGQYCLQVDGYLAVDQSATPPLVVENSHSVRDVFGVLGSAADKAVCVQVNVDGSEYCTLNFAANSTLSDVTNGLSLPPLVSGSRVTLSVLTVGKTNPGADLTVLIRL